MNFHFHGNLHVQQIQIQLPPPPPVVAPLQQASPTAASTTAVSDHAEQTDNSSSSSPEIDVRVEWHDVEAPPQQNTEPRRSRARRGQRTQQLLERLQRARRTAADLRENTTTVGSLLELMQPYESLLQDSGIHQLFNMAQDSHTATPTHPLVLQHLAIIDPPGTECSICSEDTPDQVWTKLEPCGHKFHRSCCRTWLCEHNTCPLCRQTVRLDTGQFSLHELLELRNSLGLPRSDMMEREDLERQLQEHLS